MNIIDNDTDGRESNNNNSWVLDKHVPISTVFAVVVQIIVIVWIAAHFDAKLTLHEARLDKDEVLIEGNRAPALQLLERLSSMEGKLSLLIALTGRESITAQSGKMGAK